MKRLSKLSENSILYLYSKLKHNINHIENSIDNKQLNLEQVTTVYCLLIETGTCRYNQIPRLQRLCTFCNDMQ